jgi:hypothetical protein
MKKIIYLFFGVFVLVGLTFAQSIVVTSPNGNSYLQSDSIKIVWVAQGITGDVKITLRKADGSGGIMIKESYPVNELPVNFSLVAVAEGNYFVKVKQGQIFGKSPVFKVMKKKNSPNLNFSNYTKDIKKTEPNHLENAHFTIKILKPNGGTWKEGSDMIISWENKFLNSKKINILLVKKNGQTIKVIKSNFRGLTHPHGYVSYKWKIPVHLFSSALQYVGNYKIKIASVDGKADGISNAFRITTAVKVNKYKVYASTSNKYHNKNKQKKTPLAGAPFLTSYEHSNPGNGKLRVGFANFYKKETIAYNYSGYVYRAHAFFDVSKFKGKGLMTKAVLHFNHYKGKSCGIRAYQVTKASNSLFNIETNFIDNPHENIAQIVRKWVAYPNSNFGILFTGTNESYSHNNSQCVDYYDNVYLEIEIIERD